MTETTRDTASVRQLPLDPGGEVEILLTSNNLRLRGVDGDLVTVRTAGGEAIDDEIEFDATPGRIRIRESETGFRVGGFRIRAHRTADLDIDLPRGAGLSVRTLSGDVVAAGIAGDGRWATASGDLRLDLEGGSVAIESMSGDATLRASAALSVTARSVSGDLDLAAPRLDRLAASTTSGDVRIDAALGAGVDHAISSVSGDVELATPSPVRVDTQTITGDVRANGTHAGEGGPGRRTLVVGDGSVHVIVRTTSGDFHLRAGQARDGGATAGAPIPGLRAAPP